MTPEQAAQLSLLLGLAAALLVPAGLSLVVLAPALWGTSWPELAFACTARLVTVLEEALVALDGALGGRREPLQPEAVSGRPVWCWRCDQRVALDEAGRFVEHENPRNGWHCHGSGKLPGEL